MTIKIGDPPIPATPGQLQSIRQDLNLWTVTEITSHVSSAVAPKADIASLANVAFTGNYSSLNNVPVFADVAFTGQLSSLEEIDLTTPPEEGQVLTFDGLNWIASDPPSGTINFDSAAPGSVLVVGGPNEIATTNMLYLTDTTEWPSINFLSLGNEQYNSTLIKAYDTLNQGGSLSIYAGVALNETGENGPALGGFLDLRGGRGYDGGGSIYFAPGTAYDGRCGDVIIDLSRSVVNENAVDLLDKAGKFIIETGENDETRRIIIAEGKIGFDPPPNFQSSTWGTFSDTIICGPDLIVGWRNPNKYDFFTISSPSQVIMTSLEESWGTAYYILTTNSVTIPSDLVIQQHGYGPGIGTSVVFFNDSGSTATLLPGVNVVIKGRSSTFSDGETIIATRVDYNTWHLR
ncbi:MAG: hypothetical protein N2235_01480 [Fischerella sp.]|nr:hypothetical protein [Fischerella sp.]